MATRTAAGLDDLHVHDPWYTAGMRLRAADVSEHTQGDNDMTHHYAVAQLREICDALEFMNQQHDMSESLNLRTLMRKMRLGEPPKNFPVTSRLFLPGYY